MRRQTEEARARREERWSRACCWESRAPGAAEGSWRLGRITSLLKQDRKLLRLLKEPLERNQRVNHGRQHRASKPEGELIKPGHGAELEAGALALQSGVKSVPD